jgi:hypothetical protein
VYNLPAPKKTLEWLLYYFKVFEVRVLNSACCLQVGFLYLPTMRGASTKLTVYSNDIQETFKNQVAVIVLPYLKDYLPQITDVVTFFTLISTGQFDAARKLPGVDPRAVDIAHDRLGWV